MKLGLIQACEDKYFDYESTPLGLLYIASYLKKHIGFDDVIVELENVDKLIEEKPDIVGISSYMLYFKKAIEIGKKIKKELNVPVILGGPHITSLPHSLPDCCDIGVIGEGEETMLELMKLYIKDKKFDSHKLKKIRGIVFPDKGKPFITEQRPLIMPLDKIPYPRRELLKDVCLTPSIITSRGCPYHCNFCCPRSYWREFRQFSADYVNKELLELVRSIKGYPMVRINDDVFTTNIKRLKKIHKFILENKINEQVSFDVSIKANTLNDEICKLLKDINVVRVFYGPESASDKVLEFYTKNQTAEDNQRVIDLCVKYGFLVYASFILGAPVETEEDVMMTYKFIEKNYGKLTFFDISPLEALPGTEIWNYAMERGLVSIYDREPADLMLSEHYTVEQFNKYFEMFAELNTKRYRRNIDIGEMLLGDLGEAGYTGIIYL